MTGSDSPEREPPTAGSPPPASPESGASGADAAEAGRPSTGPAAPGAEAATAAGQGPPRDRKVSTGVKLLLGCVGLVAVGMVVLAVAVGVGGFALKRAAESALGGLDEHREATEVLRRLEDDHPFDVPDDGIVTEDQLIRFLAATDLAWADLESWAEGTEELGERRRAGEEAGLRDVIAGARSLAGGARARIVLAEALEEAGISLGEYVWTGLTLNRAAEAAERDDPSAVVPPANLALVERHGARIPRLDAGSTDGDEPSRGSVLAVAVLWGVAEIPTWRAMGLDTLRAAVGR